MIELYRSAVWCPFCMKQLIVLHDNVDKLAKEGLFRYFTFYQKKSLPLPAGALPPKVAAPAVSGSGAPSAAPSAMPSAEP